MGRQVPLHDGPTDGWTIITSGRSDIDATRPDGGLYRYGRRCGRAAAAVQHNARTHSPLLLFNTTRIHSGPPSTRASIAMDGGVADTTCYYNAAAVQHNARTAAHAPDPSTRASIDHNYIPHQAPPSFRSLPAATCLAIVSVKCEWRRNSRTCGEQFKDTGTHTSFYLGGVACSVINLSHVFLPVQYCTGNDESTAGSGRLRACGRSCGC